MHQAISNVSYQTHRPAEDGCAELPERSLTSRARFLLGAAQSGGIAFAFVGFGLACFALAAPTTDGKTPGSWEPTAVSEAGRSKGNRVLEEPRRQGDRRKHRPSEVAPESLADRRLQRPPGEPLPAASEPRVGGAGRCDLAGASRRLVVRCPPANLDRDG